MDNIWSWIISLPSPTDWPSDAAPSLLLASSPNKFILFQAESTSNSSIDVQVFFSISLQEYNSPAVSRTLWVSNQSSLSSSSNLHSLLLHQLIHEIIALSPSISSLNSKFYFEQESFRSVVGTFEENEASCFFSLTLLLRLFWLCAIEAPTEAGYLFFTALTENVRRALNCNKVISNFLLAVGPDVEQRYMRSLGYMLSKWCLLRDIQSGPKLCAGPVHAACFSYATSVHGLLVLKGYAPVLAMDCVRAAEINKDELNEPKESALRYALAHQQLELVVQLEYIVCMRDPRFIRVYVHVDNLRIHVIRLGYNRQDDETELEEQDDIEIESERHFPSRVRFWVGPMPGSAYATGPSLGRSSGNPEREIENTQTVKGGFFAGSKGKGIRAKVRSSNRTRNRSWRWEQEADGSAAVFEGVLCDTATWTEVATWRPDSALTDPRTGLRRRWRGPGRAFSKKGGIVVAMDELPEGVTWRVGREMEGKKVRWRLGGRFWISYFANEVKSNYWETRCVEWNQEVELDLMTGREAPDTSISSCIMTNTRQN